MNVFYTNIRRDGINSPCSLDISDSSEGQYLQGDISYKVLLMLQAGHMAGYEDVTGGHISWLYTTLGVAALRELSSFTIPVCLYRAANESGVLPRLSGLSGLTSSRPKRS